MFNRALFLTLILGAVAAAEPSAHDPQYKQAGLWPDDVAKTEYFQQKWAPATVFTWAVSGKGAEGRQTDPKDAINWTVDGHAATTAPGPDDDVVFPTGSRFALAEDTPFHMRHCTIETGVRTAGTLLIYPTGNLWIKKDAGINQLIHSYRGGNNVFLRNDNGPWQSKHAQIANKIMFNKEPGSSLEVLGSVVVGDEMCFMSGTVIVGPDAELVPGNRSSQPIYPNGTLVLMSGSAFHKRGNQPYQTDLVVSGKLLAGTPERPLTRDCTLGLSFKTKGVKGLVDNNFKDGSAGDYGMIINPSGTLAVHSQDPKKARLVITWNGLNSLQHSGSGKKDETPRTTDLILQGQVSLAGVEFDFIRTEGIVIGNQAMKTAAIVSYGQNNSGAPDTLWRVLDKEINAKLIISFAGIKQ